MALPAALMKIVASHPRLAQPFISQDFPYTRSPIKIHSRALDRPPRRGRSSLTPVLGQGTEPLWPRHGRPCGHEEKLHRQAQPCCSWRGHPDHNIASPIASTTNDSLTRISKPGVKQPWSRSTLPGTIRERSTQRIPCSTFLGSPSMPRMSRQDGMVSFRYTMPVSASSSPTGLTIDKTP
ncbi:uncharacterized protein BJX67DRAFT_246329 [Aspergillus lucknowensis]|uniref:Uncharacterized protein n=1 Tax=Aspergillus lucknowensis TaxID=176173 RepID=A0ABR4M1R2_9EURO